MYLWTYYRWSVMKYWAKSQPSSTMKLIWSDSANSPRLLSKSSKINTIGISYIIADCIVTIIIGKIILKVFNIKLRRIPGNVSVRSSVCVDESESIADKNNLYGRALSNLLLTVPFVRFHTLSVYESGPVDFRFCEPDDIVWTFKYITQKTTALYSSFRFWSFEYYNFTNQKPR